MCGFIHEHDILNIIIKVWVPSCVFQKLNQPIGKEYSTYVMNHVHDRKYIKHILLKNCLKVTIKPFLRNLRILTSNQIKISLSLSNLSSLVQKTFLLLKLSQFFDQLNVEAFLSFCWNKKELNFFFRKLPSRLNKVAKELEKRWRSDHLGSSNLNQPEICQIHFTIRYWRIKNLIWNHQIWWKIKNLIKH